VRLAQGDNMQLHIELVLASLITQDWIIIFLSEAKAQIKVRKQQILQ
jgi:hypothetical protein